MGAAALCFAACTTGDVGKTYQATGVAGNKKVNPAFVNVNIDDVKPTFLHYLSHGYTFLGWSGFSNLRGSERATALQQAKKVGADVIIYNSDVIGSEVHGVAHTVMDSPGRTITATTNGYNSGSFNVYGDVNGYGTYSGSGTANTEIYVPPTYHTQVVPETFWRTGYIMVFLAKRS